MRGSWSQEERDGRSTPPSWATPSGPATGNRHRGQVAQDVSHARIRATLPRGPDCLGRTKRNVILRGTASSGDPGQDVRLVLTGDLQLEDLAVLQVAQPQPVRTRQDQIEDAPAAGFAAA